MHLLIDAGNSNIKWNIYDAGAKRFLMPPQTFLWRGTALTDQFQQQWGALADIRQVLLANVAGTTFETALNQWLKTQWRQLPRLISSEPRAFGVKNAYINPSQLGVDRWLAVLAARQLTNQPACVIDCGTAITVDTLNKQGEHLGGLIAPGFQLMKAALIERAHGVKITDTDAEFTPFAADTAAAVHNGVLYAALGFIERVLADIEAQIGETVVKIITGGDASLISAHLKQPFQHEPELVLKGLALYAGDNK